MSTDQEKKYCPKQPVQNTPGLLGRKHGERMLYSREKERDVSAGYALEQRGVLAEGGEVVLVLPGLGEEAADTLTELYPESNDPPLRLEITYLKGFNKTVFAECLLGDLEALAANHPISLKIVADSFGGCVVPEIVKQLQNHPNIHINKVVLTAPALDATCFSQRLHDISIKKSITVREQIRDLFLPNQLSLDQSIFALDKRALLEELLDQIPDKLNDEDMKLLLSVRDKLQLFHFSNDQMVTITHLEQHLSPDQITQIISERKKGLGHCPIDDDEYYELVREQLAST